MWHVLSTNHQAFYREAVSVAETPTSRRWHDGPHARPEPSRDLAFPGCRPARSRPAHAATPAPAPPVSMTSVGTRSRRWLLPHPEPRRPRRRRCQRLVRVGGRAAPQRTGRSPAHRPDRTATTRYCAARQGRRRGRSDGGRRGQGSPRRSMRVCRRSRWSPSTGRKLLAQAGVGEDSGRDGAERTHPDPGFAGLDDPRVGFLGWSTAATRAAARRAAGPGLYGGDLRGEPGAVDIGYGGSGRSTAVLRRLAANSVFAGVGVDTDPDRLRQQ